MHQLASPMTRLTTRLLFFTFVILSLIYFLFQSTSYSFVTDAQVAALRQQTGVAQNSVSQEEHIWTPETDLTLEAQVSQSQFRKSCLAADRYSEEAECYTGRKAAICCHGECGE